jgi:hypothetical protein
MNILFWGMTLGTAGKLLLGFAVLRVHTRIREERKIDAVVIRSIKHEEVFTALAVILIILGYIFEVAFYNGLNFFSCFGPACSAALMQALK